MELFTFGVDNGYDQTDIEEMARCWTGWSIQLVDVAERGDPFAEGITNDLFAATDLTNIVVGFRFVTNYHDTATKTIFAGNTVPSRFGAPYAGTSYELTLPTRGGTNGILDGYEVISHLANLPFTQEYISVKLCRLLVHDDFSTGYDFTNANLSAEGQLVKECMTAWEAGAPKGQVRQVLDAVFDSDLFRGHDASLQKVKTPLEYAASVIRALRAAQSNGSYTAETDGYSLFDPLARMGEMYLFDSKTPDGYQEHATAWISAGTLAERIRFVQTTCMPFSDDEKDDDMGGNFNLVDPVALLTLKLAPGSLLDAGDVADYFLAVFYPGEGKANLDLYRTSAVDFLNTDDDGVTPSPFSALTVGDSAYDTRVRGAASMLLTLPRFNEQ